MGPATKWITLVVLDKISPLITANKLGSILFQLPPSFTVNGSWTNCRTILMLILSNSDDSQIATVRNNTIGFIFQSYNLINRTTIMKNVEFPGITGGMNDNDRKRRALKLLKFLGINDKAKYKPSNLSGGQQQRVAISRALMNDPKIILADEPTGNLDTKTGQDVFNLLTVLSHKFRRTIITVTHNPFPLFVGDHSQHHQYSP